MKVRRISPATDNPALTTADEGSFVIVDTTDDDVNIPLFGPKGLDGAQVIIFKLVADNTVTITPVTGTINGASSYDLSDAGACLTFTANSEENDWAISSTTAPSISPELVIGAGDSLTYSTTPYDGAGSFQPIGPDLNLDPDAGSSTDPKYIAVSMFNLIGDALTKTKAYLAASIAKLSVTGTRSTTYPLAAHVAEVGDGVSEADGSYVAVVGGDSDQTNATAAYSVDNQNSTSGSGFDWVVDGAGNDPSGHDGYPPFTPLKGFARLAYNSVDLPVGLFFGVATDDAGIVSQVGADNTIADGSLYISHLDGEGKLFQKQNDVWIDLQA